MSALTGVNLANLLGRRRPATDSEIAAYEQAHRAAGAPADFGGPVFPNPDGAKVSDDTDSGIPVTRLPNGVSFQRGNWKGATPGDVSNPPHNEMTGPVVQTAASDFSAPPPPPAGYKLDAQPASESVPPPPVGYKLDNTQPSKNEPGWLDRELPPDAAGSEHHVQIAPGVFVPLYKNATLSGVQSLGRSARSAATGLWDLFKAPQDDTEKKIATVQPGALPIYRMLSGLGHTAKDSLDAIAAIHDINDSPDPVSEYGKMLQGMASDGAVQALTALASEGLVKGVPKAAAGVSDAKTAVTAAVKPALRTAGQTLRAIGDSADPDFVGLVSPQAAHALRLARKTGKVASKLGAPGEAPVYPGATLPEDPGVFPGAEFPEAPAKEVLQARALEKPGAAVADPSKGLGDIPIKTETPAAETPAPPAPTSSEPANPNRGAGIPRTLSGESSLRQVLTGQDNANLIKIAKSRGINITQESQLKAGVADSKLINKIIDDFSDDELDGVRSQYLENNRMGKHDFGNIGSEAWKTMGMKTYFPDVKIPEAALRRTQSAIDAAEKAKTSPSSSGATSLQEKVSNLQDFIRKPSTAKPAAEAVSEPAKAEAEPDLEEQLKKSLEVAKPGDVFAHSDPEILMKRWGVDEESLKATREQTRGMTPEQTEAQIERLSESYKKGKPVEPIMERRSSDNRFLDADGRMRVVAAHRAGLKRIPIIVRKLQPTE